MRRPFQCHEVFNEPAERHPVLLCKLKSFVLKGQSGQLQKWPSLNLGSKKAVLRPHIVSTANYRPLLSQWASLQPEFNSGLEQNTLSKQLWKQATVPGLITSTWCCWGNNRFWAAVLAMLSPTKDHLIWIWVQMYPCRESCSAPFIPFQCKEPNSKAGKSKASWAKSKASKVF